MTTLEKQIQQAINCLKTGGIVGFPTETVFGLGADATSPSAVNRVYAAKGRPRNHPLILHLSGLDKADRWVANIPPVARVLGEKFWPGPLTLVFKSKGEVARHFCGEQDTIAIRVPSNPIARELINGLGGGIVGPSANRFGRLSPTSPQDVFQELGGKVDIIIKGETCPIGIESTIVDVSREVPVILRPGMIDQRQISLALGLDITLAEESERKKAPGSCPVHYAPVIPLTVIYRDRLEKFLHSQTSGIPVAVLGRSVRPPFSGAAVWQAAPHGPRQYAKNLYSLLRRLDNSGCSLIAVEEPPYKNEWLAIHDRLGKSSTPKIALREYIKNTKYKNLSGKLHDPVK